MLPASCNPAPRLRPTLRTYAAALAVVLGAGACAEPTASDPARSASGQWQGTVTTPPDGARTLDLTLHRRGDGIVEGSAWVAQRWDTLAPPRLTHAYTARGLVQGDQLVLALAGVGTLGQPDSLALTVRERDGRLEVALAPVNPTRWNAWSAAGTLARSDVAYGAGMLSEARSDGLQLTAAAELRPAPRGGRGWLIGQHENVGLTFPGGRPAVGTYRVVPEGAAAGGAGAGEVWATLHETCRRGGCLSYRPAPGDTGELVVTVATATRVAGTYRMSATQTPSGYAPPAPMPGAAPRVVATGAFDVPCLATGCR